MQSRHSSSPSKSAHSTYSMHKGTGPIQRKRKPHNQSPTEASKKRRIARNPSEAQSGQGLRDGMVPSKETLPATSCYPALQCVLHSQHVLCCVAFINHCALQDLLNDSSLHLLWRRARKQQQPCKQRIGKLADQWTQRCHLCLHTWPQSACCPCCLSMLLCMQPLCSPSCFAITSSHTVMHNDNCVFAA